MIAMTLALVAVVFAMVTWNAYTAWRFDARLEVERQRVERLIDRVQAGSLPQYKAFENAYPDLVEPEPVRFIRDETGLMEIPVYGDDD